MLTEKYRLIVESLIAKTSDNQLGWKETAEEHTFQVSFPNYSITLSERDTIGGTRYVINILNGEGKSVDSFSDRDLGGAGLFDEPMAGLYETARRQALGADKALDEILTQLRGSR